MGGDGLRVDSPADIRSFRALSSDFPLFGVASLNDGLIFAVVFTAIGVQDVPRTIGLIQPILLLLLVGASRAIARFWLGGLYERRLKLATLPKVLIYGAGSSGRQLAAAMANSHEMCNRLFG